MKKFKIFLFTFLVLIGIGGCTKSFSGVTIQSTSLDGDTAIGMEYEKFDGTKKVKKELNEGTVLTIDVETLDGELEIIIDDDEKQVYQNNEIQTSKVTFTIPKTNTYEIITNANDHKGMYEITWNK